MNLSTCSHPAANDLEMISAIADGDERAFEQLVQSYGGQMNAVARRFLRSDDDVNDAIQDALICVFKNAGGFRQDSKLSTWLHRIVVNSCLMKLRSQRRRHEQDIEDLLPTFDETGHHTRHPAAWTDGPSVDASRTEVRQSVRDCIDRLPEEYRTVLLLRDIEQLDTDETAKLLDCTSGCVKTRLHRARQALRTLLEPMFTAGAL